MYATSRTCSSVCKPHRRRSIIELFGRPDMLLCPTPALCRMHRPACKPLTLKVVCLPPQSRLSKHFFLATSHLKNTHHPLPRHVRSPQRRSAATGPALSPKQLQLPPQEARPNNGTPQLRPPQTLRALEPKAPSNPDDTHLNSSSLRGGGGNRPPRSGSAFATHTTTSTPPLYRVPALRS